MENETPETKKTDSMGKLVAKAFVINAAGMAGVIAGVVVAGAALDLISKRRRKSDSKDTTNED